MKPTKTDAELKLGDARLPVTVEIEVIPAEPDVGIDGGVAVLAVEFEGKDITDGLYESHLEQIATDIESERRGW